MFNRGWIKEERESECCMDIMIRGITCTDCDNPLGGKNPNSFCSMSSKPSESLPALTDTDTMTL